MAAGLAGKRVLVTRAAEQAEAWIAALERSGARAVSIPLIGFEAPEDWGPMDAALAHIREFDALLLTSQNALRFLEARAESLGVRPSEAGLRTFCVGTSTLAAARERGYAVEAIPNRSADAEGMLAELLAEGELGQKRFLMPRAEGGRHALPKGLRRAGAFVELVTAYRTVATEGGREVSRLLEADALDVLTFASPSAVASFASRLSERARQAAQELWIAAIGSVTEEALRRAGFKTRVRANRPEVGALIEALEEALRQERGAGA